MSVIVLVTVVMPLRRAGKIGLSQAISLSALEQFMFWSRTGAAGPPLLLHMLGAFGNFVVHAFNLQSEENILRMIEIFLEQGNARAFQIFALPLPTAGTW